MDHFDISTAFDDAPGAATSSFDLLFGLKPPMTFYEPESLDINKYLDTKKFVAYLITNREATKKDPYHRAVASMCEYWVWWIYHKLKDKRISGRVQYLSGSFGFWGHHWISYEYNGEIFFVDMTLAQFSESYPKVAVTKEIESSHSKLYHNYSPFDISEWRNDEIIHL